MDDFERRRELRRQKREEMRLESERLAYQRNDDDDDEEAARERRRRARQERLRHKEDDDLTGQGTEKTEVNAQNNIGDEETKSTTTVRNTQGDGDDDAVFLERMARREERRQKRLQEALERQKEFDPTITDESLSLVNRKVMNNFEENETPDKEEKVETQRRRYEVEETGTITKSYQRNNLRQEEEDEKKDEEDKEETEEDKPKERAIEDNQVEVTLEKKTDTEEEAVVLEIKYPEVNAEEGKVENDINVLLGSGEAVTVTVALGQKDEEEDDEAEKEKIEEKERAEREEMERAKAEEQRKAEEEKERLEAEKRAAEEKERLEAEERVRKEQERIKAEEERKAAEEKKRIEEEEKRAAQEKERQEAEERERIKAAEAKKAAEERERAKEKEKREAEEREKAKAEAKRAAEEKAKLEEERLKAKQKAEEKKVAEVKGKKVEDKKIEDKQVKEKKVQEEIPSAASLRKKGEEKEVKVEAKKDKLQDEKLRSPFRKEEQIKDSKFNRDKAPKEDTKPAWDRKKGIPDSKPQNGERFPEPPAHKLKHTENAFSRPGLKDSEESKPVSHPEAGKRVDELRRRRGENENEEFEKMKQKQQEAAVELEELKKKREERRKILEEEEQKRKKDEAERKSREEEEKRRLKEEIERRRAEAAEKRQKMPEEAQTDEKKPFKCFTPKGSSLKIEERAEFLNKSAQKSGLKPTHTSPVVSKIDSRLEQYTSAIEGNKATKAVKPGASDLPVTAEGVRNIKSMWEKGNVFSSPSGTGTPNKETAGLKVGVSSRINEWLTKTPENNKSAPRPSDLRPGDVSSKRNLWEKQSIEKVTSPTKETAAGKKSETNAGLRQFEKDH
nr:PREDICTED: caldesmon isoform X1 [Anolis carolinensis]XP_008108707.1 PREDICTED: caldesmon isoform X1 [Anolis carolinensis]XP_016849120.1 PREDICTED: caldesmon isoform X1 [Anolis carolinensis]|eukprot:XP_008108706.1 PREDICTED: caldesmon isoform X1 [Anolis carolinensis]